MASMDAWLARTCVEAIRQDNICRRPALRRPERFEAILLSASVFVTELARTVKTIEQDCVHRWPERAK